MSSKLCAHLCIIAVQFQLYGAVFSVVVLCSLQVMYSQTSGGERDMSEMSACHTPEPSTELHQVNSDSNVYVCD